MNMTTETLKNALKIRPFHPFTIYLADGRSLRVEHPEFVGYAGGRSVAVVLPDEGVHYVDLLLVTDLALDPPTATATSREVSGSN
jgi:hypothetical protein